MQEDIIQPYLTVQEAMVYAACLKLGLHISHEDKIAVVEEVLNLLGLEKAKNSYSEYLSGGERKRLAVGLEFVNNPPVIFLDEPTTGLDDVAVKQCMTFLKKISSLGRTVACTIHQPPSSLFQNFDQVYILAGGYCVYNGSPTQLVSFFNLADYSCPPNYTPAEYMIELVHSDSSTVTNFRTMIQNGKMNMKEIRDENSNPEVSRNEEVYQDFIQVINKTDLEFPTSYKTQFLILLSRMLLQTRRNYLGLTLQTVHHLLAGLMVGGIFLGVGNNANEVFTDVKFCISCVVYIMYTHAMTPVLLLPLDIQLFKREFFNHWYSLRAFYTAWTVVNSPLLMILSIIFTALSYLISDQPRETSRFLSFCLLMMATSATSQSLGFIIGAGCSVTAGAVVAPSLMATLLALGTYGMGHESVISAFYQFLVSLSFVRNSVIGLSCVLFYQRARLTCYGENECPYTQGDILLNRHSIPITDYKYHLACVCFSMVIFKIVGYLVLTCRLNTELYSRMRYHLKRNILL